ACSCTVGAAVPPPPPLPQAASVAASATAAIRPMPGSAVVEGDRMFERPPPCGAILPLRTRCAFWAKMPRARQRELHDEPIDAALPVGPAPGRVGTRRALVARGRPDRLDRDRRCRRRRGREACGRSGGLKTPP